MLRPFWRLARTPVRVRHDLHRTQDRQARPLNPILTVGEHGRLMNTAVQREALEAINARALDAGWTFLVAPARDFEHPSLTAALALWREKAAGRAMPPRSDMTARVMKPFLTNMTLLERVESNAGRRYRVRLHGSTLAGYAGDTTGKFLEDFIAPEQIGGYLGIYDTVLQLKVPLRVVSQYQAPEIDYLTGESLVAPLAAAGATQILSVTYAKPRALESHVSLGHRVA
jgi:hypothetical protein